MDDHAERNGNENSRQSDDNIFIRYHGIPVCPRSAIDEQVERHHTECKDNGRGRHDNTDG